MLYDDAEQLEVRHVISLSHYVVDIFGGRDPVPEGELFIKRNCIRLTQRAPADGLVDPKSFYLFSENCSDKEDFYHAMLQSQENPTSTSQKPPVPLKFNTPDLVRLVQQLHASEENLHTRWINALIGRLFLAMYKTQDVERFLWTKFTKKIARVNKPALISGIHVRRIDMGDLPPFITNPRLKDLSVDGDLTVEADVSYKGNFRLEISAIARIELGSRFKAREVTLVLATILKRLEGHVLLRIKPPPSNRMWVTFETAPKMDLSIEPIVSSRQITYGVIIRAIESRIREVVGETLVFPNWDDIPFSSTTTHGLRGGLWEDKKINDDTQGSSIDDIAKETLDEDLATKLDELEPDSTSLASDQTTESTPVLRRQDSAKLGRARNDSNGTDEDVGLSSGIDQWSYTKPKFMRSGSFASAASPIVNASPATSRVDERRHQHDAALSMRTTMSRSPPSSPNVSKSSTVNPATPSHGDGVEPNDHGLEEDSLDSEPSKRLPGMSSHSLPSSAVSTPTSREHRISQIPHTNNSASTDRRSTINQSLSSATAAAKKWINSRQASNSTASLQVGENLAHLPTSNMHSAPLLPAFRNEAHGDVPLTGGTPTHSPKIDHHSGPIGRGQPLPPPGTPLPPPPKPEKRNIWPNLTRRNPFVVKESTTSHPNDSTSDHQSTPAPTRSVDTPDSERAKPVRQVPPRKSSSASSSSIARSDHKEVPPPLPKRRQRASTTNKSNDHTPPEEILVVEAPGQDGSAPSSPKIIDEHSEDDVSASSSTDRQSVGVPYAHSDGAAS
jgi:hypothetical protein